jgi:hypothetical protein
VAVWAVKSAMVWEHVHPQNVYYTQAASPENDASCRHICLAWSLYRQRSPD